MKIIKIQKQKDWVKTTINILNQGGLVIYPTETCYGIACDPINKQAVTKLLQYKKRSEYKAVSLAVCDEKMAQEYVVINESAKNLYRNFLPGPLTVVSKSKGKVDHRLEAENKTLGIRIPNYPDLLLLIRKFGKPITSTSANVAYKKTPYCLQDIVEHTSQKQQDLVDLVLYVGELSHNPPSTVVDTTLNEEKILRQGKIKISNEKFLISNSEQETQEIAKNLFQPEADQPACAGRPLAGNGQIISAKGRPTFGWKLLKKNCVILSLQGELGAGKTQFTKGLAKALGIKEVVISPTFNIVREYKFKKGTLYHVDTWRLPQEEAFTSYFPEKYLKPGNLVVIEWSEKVFDYLNKLTQKSKVKLIFVKIEHIDLRQRKIYIHK